MSKQLEQARLELTENLGALLAVAQELAEYLKEVIRIIKLKFRIWLAYKISSPIILAILFMFIYSVFIYPIVQAKADESPAEILFNKKPDYSQYEGEVIRVIDGDTLEIKMHLLPGLENTVKVRIKGIDAPEAIRFECKREKKLATEATELVKKHFPEGTWVYVENIEQGKYASRIIADVRKLRGTGEKIWETPSWQKVDELLLNEKLAKPYDKKFDWCKNKKK